MDYNDVTGFPDPGPNPPGFKSLAAIFLVFLLLLAWACIGCDGKKITPIPQPPQETWTPITKAHYTRIEWADPAPPNTAWSLYIRRDGQPLYYVTGAFGKLPGAEYFCVAYGFGQTFTYVAGPELITPSDVWQFEVSNYGTHRCRIVERRQQTPSRPPNVNNPLQNPFPRL